VTCDQEMGLPENGRLPENGLAINRISKIEFKSRKKIRKNQNFKLNPMPDLIIVGIDNSFSTNNCKIVLNQFCNKLPD
jgi:hypothetical protein